MKNSIKSLANSLGYEIRKAQPPKEPEESKPTNYFEELKRLCAAKAEPVIFDVGAHVGHTAMKFRHHFPKAKIHCFEPFPESFNELKTRTGEDSSIVAHGYGLSNENHTAEFHANTLSVSNSLLPTDQRAHDTWGVNVLETQQKVQAQFRMLDSVIDELQVEHIDILKLDVQGAEPLVLQGAKNSLASGKVSYIYSEIITMPTYVGQLSVDELLKAYRECGFEIHNIFNLSWTSERRLRQIDAIFTRLNPAAG